MEGGRRTDGGQRVGGRSDSGDSGRMSTTGREMLRDPAILYQEVMMLRYGTLAPDQRAQPRLPMSSIASILRVTPGRIEYALRVGRHRATRCRCPHGPCHTDLWLDGARRCGGVRVLVDVRHGWEYLTTEKVLRDHAHMSLVQRAARHNHHHPEAPITQWKLR